MERVFLEAEAFDELGGWVIDQQSIDQMGSAYIMAHGMGCPVADARTRFAVAQEGFYAVWARTRDWTAVWGTGTPAGRFLLKVDGYALETVLGTNGPAWRWQYAGRIHLHEGEHALAACDLTGFNGRLDAVYLTDDAEDVPPDEAGLLHDFRRKLVWKEIDDHPEASIWSSSEAALPEPAWL